MRRAWVAMASFVAVLNRGLNVCFPALDFRGAYNFGHVMRGTT